MPSQGQGLVLTQKQQLKLSPQMYQSLELLALPLQDLQSRIQEEMERNPALALGPSRDASYERVERSSRKADYDPFENSSDPGYVRKSNQGDSDSKQKFMEGALYRSESLQEHLSEQLRLQPLSEQEYQLGELLISNLDEHGFCGEDPYSVAPEGTPPQQVERVIQLIRTFDPPGVCTSGFQEALITQCRLDPNAHELSIPLIEHYLEQLRRGKYEYIAKELNTTVEDILEALTYIKTLNPYPGSLFSSRETSYVTPDLVIRKRENSLVMALNSDQIPLLSIDPDFEHMLEDEHVHKDRETEKYIQKSIRDAQWLISSLEMRNSTLKKVGAALMKYQYDFFVHGPKYLRPLTLKDIAEEISVHETTVSRIANAKYIQTDWGIFPIKYFFTNAVSGTSDDGKEASKTGVKEVIREIIQNYSGKKRLSDQKISDMLKERGISVARRTVAKYRSELNIDSSFDRNSQR
ncbi:MAG: RNA polymerase factor sigma-54 [Spirochaetota bacterium]